MKPVKLLGLALFALFALSAVASSVAAAELPGNLTGSDGCRIRSHSHQN